MNLEQLNLFNLPPEPSPVPGADAPTDPSWGVSPKLRGVQLHLPGEDLQLGDVVATPWGEGAIAHLPDGLSFCWVRVRGRLRVVWFRDCAKVGVELVNK